MHFNRHNGGKRLVESVAYAVMALSASLVVSIILGKAGVSPAVLLWVTFFVVSLVIVAAANTHWPSRLAGYAVIKRTASPSMIASGQLVSVVPIGIAVAYWTAREISVDTVLLTLAALAGGLWLSVLTVGRPINRSGAYSLPQLLEVRFGSGSIRTLSLVLLAVPMFLLVCGQLVAYGLFAEHLLGLPVDMGICLASAVVALIIWLPGVRGILLAGAISMVFLVITFAFLYIFTSVEALPVKPLAVTSREIFAKVAFNAAPLLKEASAVSSNWADLVIFAFSAAIALSITPVFTQFHCLVATGSKTVKTGFATTFAAVVLSLIAIATHPVVSFAVLQQSAIAGGGAILAGLAALAILVAIPATGAALLFGFCSLISFDGYRGLFGRTVAENGRLIAARMTVITSAVLALWATLTWKDMVISSANLALFAAAGAMLPVVLAAIHSKKCNAASAISGMLVGGSTVICIWLARNGIIDPAALVSGPNPVLDTIVSLSLAEASLVGMVLGAVAIIAVSFLPHASSHDPEPFFEAIDADRQRRLLNETAL